MSRWLERRVISFAHQGGSFEGPSSTLWAIERSLSVGVSALELDVHATRDGHLVVCHDDTVDRTTNGTGEIAQLTLAELRALDNAYWWIEGETVSPGHAASAYLYRGRAPGDRAFAVATLEEVAQAAPGVLLNLDIKRTSPDVDAYEEILADEIARLGLGDSVIVASFHDDALRRFRLVAPEVATSAGTRETSEFFFSLDASEPVVPPAVALQVPETYGDVRVVTERFVEVAHHHSLAVHVWTVNDEESMRRLLDLGVDGIISDRPRVLVTELERRQVHWRG